MNLFDLEGKAALVTGGNGGIGLGMAKGLAQAGARVAIAGRDRSKNASAVKALGGNAISLEADLKDEKTADKSECIPQSAGDSRKSPRDVRLPDR
jgi:2-deoxy-D-gluconate 3-dehydrogenase